MPDTVLKIYKLPSQPNIIGSTFQGSVSELLFGSRHMNWKYNL